MSSSLTIDPLRVSARAGPYSQTVREHRILDPGDPRELPRYQPPARVQVWDEKAVLWGLVAVVLVVPLPAGGHRPWAWSALALAAGALLAAWSMRALAGRAMPVTALWHVRWPAALYLSALAWALAQWAPWTPSALHHPIWAEAAAVLGGEADGRITINPGATLTGIMRLASYGALFLLAFLVSLRTRSAEVLLGAIALSATLCALYGLINHPILGGRLGLDFDPEPAARWNFSGPFDNRNTYATMLGIGVVCLLGLLLREAHAALAALGSGGRRLGVLTERLLAQRIYLPLSLVPVALALVLTASRAGTAATALAVAVLLAAAVRVRRLARGALACIALLSLLGGLAAFVYGGERLAERTEGMAEQLLVDGGATALLGTRATLNALTLRASRDTPVGIGLGGFADVFPHYRDGTLSSRRHYEFAHNSYTENALELGWLGAGALFLSVAVCALLCWVGLARRRRSFQFPVVGLAATALVAFHAMFDFSLQIPAVAAVFAVLMGMCCAQSLPSDLRADGVRREGEVR